MAETTYDCVIVGGGPAGLSAAIYMARFDRSTLLLDSRGGRSTFHQVNENYLGFPNGVEARKLRRLGRQQAARLGAELVDDKIDRAWREGDDYCLKGRKRTYRARTVIIATGVRDLFPEIAGCDDYVGRSLFWCLTCDAQKVKGKRIVMVGNDDEAACSALQLSRFSDQLTFVTNCDPQENKITQRWKDRLEGAGIRVVEACVDGVAGAEGLLRSLGLRDGTTLDLDALFSLQGAEPRVELAKQLGVELASNGYVKVDVEQRTNVERVYAAGDVTRMFSHQVVTAAHEGSMAAQAANYDLYPEEMRAG